MHPSCRIVMTLRSMNGMSGISGTSGTRYDGSDRAAGWGWFLAWVLVGACAGIGLAAILTVGVVFVVLAAVAAVFLLRTGPARAVVGGVSGVALPLFYLAYLNRGGPGRCATRCRAGSPAPTSTCLFRSSSPGRSCWWRVA